MSRRRRSIAVATAVLTLLGLATTGAATATAYAGTGGAASAAGASYVALGDSFAAGPEAQARGAVFVDAYRSSLGHDACAPRAAKWVEGIFPTHPAYPVHPNATGMQQVAGMVENRLAVPAA